MLFRISRKINEELREQAETLWHTTNIYLHTKLYEYVEELTSTLPSNLNVSYSFIIIVVRMFRFSLKQQYEMAKQTYNDTR